LASNVSLKGVPDEVSIDLVKGQSINYEGCIEDVIDFLGLTVFLLNVEIVEQQG